MRLVDEATGEILGYLSVNIPRVGETVCFGSAPVQYRVVNVFRNYAVRHEGTGWDEDVSVFVIPISESSERLPHED